VVLEDWQWQRVRFARDCGDGSSGNGRDASEWRQGRGEGAMCDGGVVEIAMRRGCWNAAGGELQARLLDGSTNSLVSNASGHGAGEQV
jgi:hypothetical protein